jgi:predicted hydrocarbon binding protein
MKRVFTTTTETGFIMQNNNKTHHEIILEAQALQDVSISSLIFNSRKFWKVEFHNGIEALLYKCGNEWMQRIEDNLDVSSLVAIGKYIDGTIAGNV